MAIEYLQYSSPSGAYCARIEVAMNFLNQVVLGEPCNPFPDDPTPIVFEAVEGGQLIAAAAVTQSSQHKDQFTLNLVGVIPGRRDVGVGGELLQYVERGVVQLGACALLASPMSTRAEHFFAKNGYVSANDPDYLAKLFTT